MTPGHHHTGPRVRARGYAETLRAATGDSTAAIPAIEAPLGITRAPALNGNPVGKRVELGHYTITAGDRIEKVKAAD